MSISYPHSHSASSPPQPLSHSTAPRPPQLRSPSSSVPRDAPVVATGRRHQRPSRRPHNSSTSAPPHRLNAVAAATKLARASHSSRPRAARIPQPAMFASPAGDSCYPGRCVHSPFLVSSPAAVTSQAREPQHSRVDMGKTARGGHEAWIQQYLRPPGHLPPLALELILLRYTCPMSNLPPPSSSSIMNLNFERAHPS